MHQPEIRFAVTGLNHGHIYGQTRIILETGAVPVCFYAPEDDLAATFSSEFPQIPRVNSLEEILEDESIQLVLNAGIPAERAKMGIKAMQHGKDYMVDKPGMTTIGQLDEVRRVQSETGQIYSVWYCERFHNRAATKATELVQAGAIGDVIQTVSLGPHRRNLPKRPDWFFIKEQYGGILTDIGSHNFDQFLHYTGSTSAEIVTAQVSNFHHPEHPELEDFGDVVVRGNGGSGYIRVDWFTPEGLGIWGDGRLFITGTDGYIELRKYIDIAGRPDGDHLFLVNQKETKYIDCKNVPLTYASKLVDDIINRTETAMSQENAFLAMELAVNAELKAARLGNLSKE